MPSSVSSLVNKDGPASLFDVRIDRVSTFGQSETSKAGTWSEKRNATHATKTGGNFFFCYGVFFNKGHGPIMALFFFYLAIGAPKQK